MNVEELIVQPGEPIQPAWMRLVAWVQKLSVQAFGDGVAVHYDPRQITVVYDPDIASFVGRFHVSLITSAAKNSAKLGDGVVNGSLVPLINGTRIDGVKDPNKPAGERPLLSLASGPNKDLRSWVLIQGKIDLKTGKLVDKDPLTFVHSNDWDKQDPGVDDKGFGRDAVAMLIWRDQNTLDRVHQIVLHDLKHEFKPALKGGKGRHFFLAA